MKTRWVYTRKEDGTAKARLTVRGDLEKRHDYKLGFDPVPADSPTVSRVGLRMFFAIAAQARWNLESFDVPTAFLQADKSYMYNRRQVLYLEPPVELKQYPDEVWECEKVPYGCTDAPRAWYFSFNEWMKSMKGRPVAGDSCIYTFYEKNGELRGQVVIHVDDGIMAGTEEFLREMRSRLKTRWTINEFKRNEFKFCGLWVTKLNACIYVDQQKYADMVDEIPMTRLRASQVTQKMTPNEIKSVQSVAGAANWMATQTRPDLSFDVSELVGLVAHDGTVQCIK